MVDCPPPSSPCISCDTAGAVCSPYDDYNGSYNNYPRGLFWAPRGKHLVSYFADNTCRVFDVDQGLAQPTRTEQASGTITAVEMCPLGAEPADFHYAVSVRDRPIHLVNLLTGEVAASYQGYSLTDEVRAASCLAFSQDGSRLLGGVAGQPQVWLWDLTRPGKSAYHRVLSTRKGKTGQRGIVSAAAWVDDKCYALGTYSRTIGIYDERQGSKRNAKCVKMLSASDGGGITSLKLSPQGLLVSGHRMDTSMRVWDLRSSGVEPVTMLPRATKTNQRFDFSFLGNSRILATGDDSGHVLWYDTLTGDLLGKCCVASSGAPCIAAEIEPVSLSRLAVGTGQRVWPTYVSMGDDDNTELLQPKTDNRVAVVNFSAPEGLLSTTLPAAVPTPIEAPPQNDQPVMGSDSEEAAAQVSELAEPQSVIIPEAFKGLPPPPGVITPPCNAQMPCNDSHEDPADSSPLEGQAEAGPTTGAANAASASSSDFRARFIEPYQFQHGNSIILLHQRAPSLAASNPSEGLDQEEADPLNTGVTVWPSSADLASRLIDESGSGSLLDVAGKRVIELGSGCGLGGLACAAAGASKVTLTDLPEVLNDVTKRNIGANSVLTWACDLQAKPLAWPGEDSAELGDFDVILGADLIYREADVDLLLAAIRNLVQHNRVQRFIWMQPSRDPIANAKAMNCFRENGHGVTTVGPDLYVVDLSVSTDREQQVVSEDTAVVPDKAQSVDEGGEIVQRGKRSREDSDDDAEPMKRSRARRGSVYPGMESYDAAVFTAFESCGVRSDNDSDGKSSSSSDEDAIE